MKNILLFSVIVSVVAFSSIFYVQVAQGQSQITSSIDTINQCTIEAIPISPIFYKVENKSVPSEISVIITTNKTQYIIVDAPDGSSFPYYYEMPTRYSRQNQIHPTNTFFVKWVNVSLLLEIYYTNGTLLSKVNLVERDIRGPYGITYNFPNSVPPDTYPFRIRLYDIVLREQRHFLKKVYYNDIYFGEVHGYISLKSIPR